MRTPLYSLPRICILLCSLFLYCATGNAQSQLQQSAEQLPVHTIPAENSTNSSFLVLKDSSNLALETNQPVKAAGYMQRMGIICFHLGHYPQALDYLLQAGKLFRQHSSWPQLAACLNDIGMLYYYNRQPTAAKKEYEEAMRIYRKINDPNGIATTYGKIGHLYEKEQQHDSAFLYQRIALSYYKQLNDQDGMAKIYENIGSVFEDLEQYDSAFANFNLALELNRQTKDETAQIEIINNLGDILRKTGRYREGLQLSRQAAAMAIERKEQYQLCSAYRDMGKAFHLLGNNDSAYHYLELSRNYLLNIYSAGNGKQLALLQTIYDIEKKNNEIEKLQHARDINRLITYATIVGILLLIILGWLVISRQRLKIKNEQLLSRQHKDLYETERALKETALQHKILQEAQLKGELEVKSKELSTHTLHIIQKNQLLETLRGQVEVMINDERRDQKKQLRQILQQINQNFNHDQHWDEFRQIFEQVHQSFYDNLRLHCDNLTSNDLRLISLLKMNISSADMATLLGISPDSLRVVRYRLRKKLDLKQGDSLTAFIQSL